MLLAKRIGRPRPLPKAAAVFGGLCWPFYALDRVAKCRRLALDHRTTGAFVDAIRCLNSYTEGCVCPVRLAKSIARAQWHVGLREMFY